MSKGADTETINADPWDVAVPYMEGGFKEAQNMYNDYTPQYYSGQTQAGFSPDQLTAQQGIRDFATQGAPSIMNPALSAYQRGTGSGMLDVANNPYVNKMAQAAADRAMGALTGVVLLCPVDMVVADRVLQKEQLLLELLTQLIRQLHKFMVRHMVKD